MGRGKGGIFNLSLFFWTRALPKFETGNMGKGGGKGKIRKIYVNLKPPDKDPPSPLNLISEYAPVTEPYNFMLMLRIKFLSLLEVGTGNELDSCRDPVSYSARTLNPDLTLL